MSFSFISRVIVLFLTVLLLLSGLIYYHAPVASVSFGASPADQRPRLATAVVDVQIGEIFVRSAPLPAEREAVEWPGFRGARRDNIVPAAAVAGIDWGMAPQVCWRRPLGEGYAAPVVWQGLVYLLIMMKRNRLTRYCV